MLKVGDKVVFKEDIFLRKKREELSLHWIEEVKEVGVLTIESIEFMSNSQVPVLNFHETIYSAMATWVEKVEKGDT